MWEFWETTLRSEDRGARERHPMHVLTGSILHLWAGSPPTRAGAQFDSRIESGWMSIFAPVSFAARRAFWPSLPIASESW